MAKYYNNRLELTVGCINYTLRESLKDIVREHCLDGLISSLPETFEKVIATPFYIGAEILICAIKPSQIAQFSPEKQKWALELN